MKPRAVLVAVLLWVVLVARLSATSISVSPRECELCGAKYCDSTDPSCPRCLYIPDGRLPEKFTAEQAAQIHAAIASYPASLPPDTLKWLQASPEFGEMLTIYDYDTPWNRLPEDLIARCDAARRGAPLPRPTFAPVYRQPCEDDYEKYDALGLLRQRLPGLLDLQRRGQPVPDEISDAEGSVSTLTAACYGVEAGDPLAWEFLTRWALTADLEMVSDLDWRMRYIAVNRPLPWPEGVDPAKAKLPALMDCLRYASDASLPLPDPLRVQLAKPWSALSEVTVAACQRRRDRAALPVLAPMLAGPVGEAESAWPATGFRRDLNFLAIRFYYALVGSADEIPALARRIQIEWAWLQLRPEPDENEYFRVRMVAREIQSYSDAIREIQLRDYFAGRPLTSY